MTKKDENIYLSIVIPFKNQANVLERTIKDLIKFTDEVDFKTQVILADTHSSDGSLDLAKKYANQIEHFEVVEPTDTRGGKGQGIHDGIAVAKGKYIMFMDADSSTPIFEINKLLPYIEDYDIVTGSRYIKEPRPYNPNYFSGLFRGIKEVVEVLIFGHAKDYQAVGKQGRIRQFISRGGNLAFTVLLGQSYVDQRCGFKLYRSNVAKLLAGLQTIYGNAVKGKDHGFGFDTEYWAIAQKYHFKTIEVPVYWFDSAETAIPNPVRDTFYSFKDIFRVQWNLVTGKYSKKNIQKKLDKNLEEIILDWK
jgi:dolichyl-phosphate beta-glucosyltransferase